MVGNVYMCGEEVARVCGDGWMGTCGTHVSFAWQPYLSWMDGWTCVGLGVMTI